MAAGKKRTNCTTKGCRGKAFACAAVCIDHFNAETMAPPLPAAVDLRTFDDMPLNVRVLRDSGIASEASDEGFKAAVLLWCAAWHHIPAASLPDNEATLARLAGYGRDLRGWKRVREEALRGFVRCKDGLLYHLYMCDKAWEAWGKSEAGRTSAAARWGSGQDIDNSENQGMRSDDSGTPSRIPTASRNAPASVHATGDADALRSQCSEQNRDITTTSSIPTTAPARASAAAEDYVSKISGAIWHIAGQTQTMDRWRAGGKIDDFRHVRAWIEKGFTEGEILGVARAVIEKAGEIRSLWGLLARAVPEEIAKLREGVSPAAAPGSGAGVHSNAEYDQWKARYVGYRERKEIWPDIWGPKPGERGCQCPQKVIDDVELALPEFLKRVAS